MIGKHVAIGNHVCGLVAARGLLMKLRIFEIMSQYHYSHSFIIFSLLTSPGRQRLQPLSDSQHYLLNPIASSSCFYLHLTIIRWLKFFMTGVQESRSQNYLMIAAPRKPGKAVLSIQLFQAIPIFCRSAKTLLVVSSPLHWHVHQLV